MTEIHINLDEQVFAPVSEFSLEQLVLRMDWPEGATCATQESDGEISYWSAPVEEVERARQKVDTGEMMGEVGFRYLVHATYTDLDKPVVGFDWNSALVRAPAPAQTPSTDHLDS